MIPVQLRFVLVVEAQQHRVKGKTFDPPAGLDGPVLHVFGELQNLQPNLSVITQSQKAPEGEDELVQHTSSVKTGGLAPTIRTGSHHPPLLYLVFIFKGPLINSRSAEYIE